MNALYFGLKCARKVHKIFCGESNWFDESRVQLFDQEANDYIRKQIITSPKEGLMISKFGTVELSNLVCHRIQKSRWKYIIPYIKGECVIFPKESMERLCLQAGFFPNDITLLKKYYQTVLEDMKQIDILGSYIRNEIVFEKELRNAVTVNLEGYYAPFLWNNPWTSALKGKKVLVVHPFVESIQAQYEKREYIFEDKNVLPEFGDLILVKAVQSIANNGDSSDFGDWFDALEYMKKEIDKHEFDVALIGCGAYGMDLAAHVKRKGKIAVHMAGWTQMLFGIYGNRWLIDQPKFKNFINEYWTRPLDTERPVGVEKVENACYW